MRYTVDRIEEKIVVLEDDNLNYINIPIDKLPQNISEGSVLYYDGICFSIDETELLNRRRLMFEKQKMLFKKISSK